MLALVISVLSLVVVGACVLVFVFYGGSAFFESPEGEAAKLVQQGQQLLAASELYFSEHKQWPTKEQLLKGNALTSVPVASAGGPLSSAQAAQEAWSMPTAARPLFVFNGAVVAETCALVNLKGSLGLQAVPLAASTRLPVQCFGAGTPANPFRVVAKKFMDAGSLADANLPVLQVWSGAFPGAEAPGFWSVPPSQPAARALEAAGLALPAEAAAQSLGSAAMYAQAQTREMVYRNSSDTLQSVLEMQIAEKELRDVFQLAQGNCEAAELAPQDSCTYSVTLRPGEASPGRGHFAAHIVARLKSGASVASGSVSGEVRAFADAPTKGALDFGTLRLAEYSDQRLVYRNDTGQAQVVREMRFPKQRTLGFSPSEGFQVVDGCHPGMVLLPAQSCQMLLTYQPFGASGPQTSKLVLVTDAGETELPVTLQATVQEPTVVGFPAIADGARSAPQMVTYVYTAPAGSGAMTVDRATASLAALGADAVLRDGNGEVSRASGTESAFEVVQDGCAGKVLTPGQSCSFAVRFAPKGLAAGRFAYAGAGVLAHSETDDTPVEVYGDLELRGSVAGR